MSVIIVGMQIMWGVNGQKPAALPQGYRYIEGAESWLLAEWRAPSLRNDHRRNWMRFYVSSEGSGVLYKQGFKLGGVCSECGNSKSRQYIDTDTTIQLPQKQLTYPVKRL